MELFGLLRPTMLAASRSARVERAVTRMPVTRKLVARFVAGETEREALSVAETLLGSGRSISIDYLGEDTTELAQARNTVSHYLQLLSALSEVSVPAVRENSAAGQVTSPRSGAGAPSNEIGMLEVSLKLSALGQSLPHSGHQHALEHAHQICTAATQAGIMVTIDAEDHTTTDSTLSIVRELRSDFPSLGTVLQAYLHRTEDDCRDLSGPGSRIRLCKGAYAEPASVAYQQKAAVDESYLRCLRVLMNGDGYPMVATHDPALIHAAQRYATEFDRKADAWEFQMLYGIRDTEQLRLVNAEHRLRVYLPYGDQWYGYFMRRLAERPANVAFFLRSMKPGSRR